MYFVSSNVISFSKNIILTDIKTLRIIQNIGLQLIKANVFIKYLVTGFWMGTTKRLYLII